MVAMQKKIGLFMVFIALVLVAIMVFALGFNNARPAIPDNEPNSSETSGSPDGPLLVIPETTLGTIGALIAVFAACGLFALKKRKQH